MAVRVNLASTVIDVFVIEKLSQLINTPVQFGKVEINWLNQIVVTDLKVDTILYVRRAMVGYDIWPLMNEKRLELSTAQFIDFNINLSRDSAGTLNIQPIIDAVSSKEEKKDPLISQFQIGTLHLRRGNISFYDNLDATDKTYRISELYSNVHFKNNNLEVKQLECIAQTPYGMADVEGSLIKNELNFILINDKTLAAGIVQDITVPIDSLQYNIEIGQYQTNIPKIGNVNLSGTFIGVLSNTKIELEAQTPIGEFKANGSIIDTVRFTGSVTAAQLNLQLLQRIIKTEQSALLNRHLYNTKVDVDIDLHQGGDVLATFTLNDSLVSADVAVSTTVSDPLSKSFDLNNIAPVKVDAQLKRLSIQNVPDIISDITAEFELASREGYVSLSNTKFCKTTDTLELEPLIIEGTRFRGYIKSPLMHADYSTDRSLEILNIKGRIPSVNHIISFLDIPLRLTGNIPFDLNIDDEFSFAYGHIDLPVFRVESFHYDNPLSLDIEADFKQKLFNLYPTNDIDLTSILGTLESEEAHVGGLARGPITISDGMVIADLNVRNFTYIDTLIGSANIIATYDFQKSNIGLKAYVDSRTGRSSFIKGGVALANSALGRNSTVLDLDFQTDSLPIGFINIWTGSFLQDFTGTATGHVALKGKTSELVLTGNPRVDGTFTHSIVGTRFHLHDSFVMEPEAMFFSDAHVYDDNHHLILLNASIRHKHLDDFLYDVNISTNQDFLLFNKPEADKGALYWGQLYTNGTARLNNLQGSLNIDLDMSTSAGSWLNLSPYAARIDDKAAYTFLTYRNAQSLAGKSSNLQDSQSATASTMQASLRVSATEQCRISVKLDPLSLTDELQCRGNGNLVLQYDPRNDLTISGIFNITSGNYNINMQQGLLNKIFRLQSGSSVHFNGVPSDADLNINATYNIPSANLMDLDENIATLGSLGRTTVPVDCQLAVTGQLAQPQVGFDLSLRNVSDEVQAYVHNIIGTPEMLNQEVLYLLLFNRFYTPDYAQQSTRTSRGGGELASFATSSVTAGLNQLLNKVSDHVSICSSVTSERGDFSDVQADISLTTRFLDNRLILGGNFGYRDPSSSRGAGNASKFIGDFDAEFLMNTRGTVRFKAYSHSSQRDYNINNAQTTQGLGIIIRKDF